MNYNSVTKEITCNGVKISDVKYGPVIIPDLVSAVVKLEEQTFIQFKNSKCKVIFKLIFKYLIKNEQINNLIFVPIK